jgi:hypothetical protein
VDSLFQIIKSTIGSALSEELNIYVCDTGFSHIECDALVQTTEQVCKGHYAAYTYAKQTLGCSEFPFWHMPVGMLSTVSRTASGRPCPHPKNCSWTIANLILSSTMLRRKNAKSWICTRTNRNGPFSLHLVTAVDWIMKVAAPSLKH